MTTPTTTIHSNGSKWAGQAPDSIDTLVDVLGREPLRPIFEEYGGFVYPVEGAPGTVRFFGNFEAVSHVFRIDSDDPAVIDRLTTAIRANLATPAYLEARRAYVAHRDAETAQRDAKEQSDRRDRARQLRAQADRLERAAGD